MSKRSELLGRKLLGAGALVAGLTMIAIADRASAQYDCDERFQDCYRRPPPPQLPFPFGLFQPREAAPPPPQPEPRQADPRQLPPRPDNMERPVDPALARQYAALYAPANGEPFAVPAVRLSDIDPQYLRKRVNVQTDEAPGT